MRTTPILTADPPPHPTRLGDLIRKVADAHRPPITIRPTHEAGVRR